MKRILTVFPAVICLILSLCVPLCASADDFSYTHPVGENYPYYTKDRFQSDFHYLDDPTGLDYLYVASYFPDSAYRTNSLYLQTSSDNVSLVEEDNGVYKVSFTDLVTLTRIQSEYGGGFDSGYDFSVRSFMYDSNNNTIVFYSGVNFSSEVWIPGDWKVFQVDTSLFEYSSLPDVVVRFKPTLKGNVDRTVTDSDGTKSTLQDLRMYVTNNSSFPIQYKMSIYLDYQSRETKRNYDQIFQKVDEDHDVQNPSGPGNFTVPPSTVAPVDSVIEAKKDWLNIHYDDDPVFIYYSNTLVYEGAIKDNSVTRDDDNPMLFNKASPWHKVEAKSSVEVTIPFSMINLKENKVYYVSVECYRLDLDHVCDIVRPKGYNGIHVENETYIEPYREVFRFTSYSDVVYNPIQTSGDVLPFDGYSGISQCFSYNDNYDAVTDLKTGEQKIGHRDFLKDPNSWYNNGLYYGSTGGGLVSSGNSSMFSFSGMFSQVFGAVKMFTNYLPSSIMTIFTFGFSSIVVIAIIKAVR